MSKINLSKCDKKCEKTLDGILEITFSPSSIPQRDIPIPDYCPRCFYSRGQSLWQVAIDYCEHTPDSWGNKEHIADVVLRTDSGRCYELIEDNGRYVVVEKINNSQDDKNRRDEDRWKHHEHTEISAGGAESYFLQINTAAAGGAE